MNSCSKGHWSIWFKTTNCPLCEKREVNPEQVKKRLTRQVKKVMIETNKLEQIILENMTEINKLEEKKEK